MELTPIYLSSLLSLLCTILFPRHGNIPRCQYSLFLASSPVLQHLLCQLVGFVGPSRCVHTYCVLENVVLFPLTPAKAVMLALVTCLLMLLHMLWKVTEEERQTRQSVVHQTYLQDESDQILIWYVFSFKYFSCALLSLPGAMEILEQYRKCQSIFIIYAMAMGGELVWCLRNQLDF